MMGRVFPTLLKRTSDHQWVSHPGGAPADCTYYWCRTCGAFCYDPSGDPEEFFVPGESSSRHEEPPCRDPRPICLAFLGASGTGKTTLATAIAAERNLPFCPVGSRSVAKGMGFESPYDVDVAGKRSEFQQLLFHQKLEWERGNIEAGFVTDRTHLDNLAYTMGHEPELGLSPVFRRDVALAMRVYTHLVFCPIASFHNVGDDPARVAADDDNWYHRKFETVLVELVGTFVGRAPILWLTASDRETRLQQVRGFVRP